MSKQSGVEWRVVWRRVGARKKERRFATEKAARRRLDLLTSEEPWVAMRKDPDEPMCCRGAAHECGCGGETARQYTERLRAEMPPLEYAHIESRAVSVWSPSLDGAVKTGTT